VGDKLNVGAVDGLTGTLVDGTGAVGVEGGLVGMIGTRVGTGLGLTEEDETGPGLSGRGVGGVATGDVVGATGPGLRGRGVGATATGEEGFGVEDALGAVLVGELETNGAVVGRTGEETGAEVVGSDVVALMEAGAAVG
jgi:hypothetical protein